MIRQFKETEMMRDSGIIYKSQFEQIKKLFSQNKELAGELAISAIELVLTGEYSSDDFTVDLLLTQNKVIVDKDKENYEKTLEAKAQARIKKLKLEEIAEMLNNGVSQKIIADTIGESQRVVSYRKGIIEKEFPEMLNDFTKITQITEITLYDNDNDNDNDNVPSLSSKEKSSPPSSESWGSPPKPPANSYSKNPIGFQF
jgi:hypothetical protein